MRSLQLLQNVTPCVFSGTCSATTTGWARSLRPCREAAGRQAGAQSHRLDAARGRHPRGTRRDTAGRGGGRRALRG